MTYTIYIYIYIYAVEKTLFLNLSINLSKLNKWWIFKFSGISCQVDW